MADSVYPNQGGVLNTTKVANFIPEIWSDEVVAAYKRSLVTANHVSTMPMSGKKGGTIHVPTPSRGVANRKVSGTAVTIQDDTAGTIDIVIDQHFEYSRLIEDIADKQALSSMRSFYTKDAGYALAKQVDDHLQALGTGLGGGTLVLEHDGTGADWVNTQTFANIAGTMTPYAVDQLNLSLTDQVFRDMIQVLDDADVPMDERVFIIPPSLRNTIMGIERFSSSDFVNGRVVNTGLIGDLYGVDVFVSTNCAVIEEASENTSMSQDTRAATLLHRDAYVYAEQQGVRSQAQYKQEWLADLFTADTWYGVQVMRDDAAVVLAVSN